MFSHFIIAQIPPAVKEFLRIPRECDKVGERKIVV